MILQPKPGDIVACDWATAIVLATMQDDRILGGRFKVRLYVVASDYGTWQENQWITWNWITLNGWEVVDEGAALEWLLALEEKGKIVLDLPPKQVHSALATTERTPQNAR